MSSLQDVVRQMVGLLSQRDRRRLLTLIVLSTITAALQIVGIASIMPFLSLVTNPQRALENPWMYRGYELLGFQSPDSFLIFIGVMVLVALAVSNGAAAVTKWFTLRFSWSLGHSLSKRLLADYIYRPYEFFLGRNSADLGTKVLSEVWEVVQTVILPTITALSNGILAAFILGLLVFVDPFLALVALSILGGLYAIVYFIVRQRLSALGTQRIRANHDRFVASSEAFGGIKDVKILGKERTFLDRYDDASSRYVRAKTAGDVIRTLPNYALELIAFGGIVLIVLYLLATDRELASVLPIIGVYAFASYRLKPALQSIYSATTAIRHGAPSLRSVHEDFRHTSDNPSIDRSNLNRLPLTDRIELDRVSFHYSDRSAPVLKNVSLDIPARTSVAFVGATGSGKTTLVDIIMGLLVPRDGLIRVDGLPLEGDRRLCWQNSIGYVPQQIYLSDTTVANNIAFGRTDLDVNMTAVTNAAKMANIHDFIVEELSDGYATVVGERGVRLSGGQRQRIGIARALYDDPEVLILDEATSALDSVTEEGIYDAVESVRLARTVIIVAHRLNTIQDCDTIFLLDKGQIVDQGTYSELLASSRIFRQMAMSHDGENTSVNGGNPH